MFPASQRSNTSYIRLHDVFETASRPVAKDSPFHVRRFDFASTHFDLAIFVNQALRNVY